jgi:hypothetical protein
VTEHPAPGPVGWVFRLELPNGRRNRTADGPKAHAVKSVEDAFSIFRKTGGTGTLPEFEARLRGYDPRRGPTDPLTRQPTRDGELFCCPLLPAASAAAEPPVPVVAADGPYPPDLLRLAVEYRPLFHLPSGVSIADVGDVFKRAGYADADTLYEKSPGSIPLPAATDRPVVYGHLVVRRAHGVVRAFAQYYVLLVAADTGKATDPKKPGGKKADGRGGWQFVQIEFVKGPKDERYTPMTVGCSTRTGGQACFYDAEAWPACQKNHIHPRAVGSGQFADLSDKDKKRPRVYVGWGGGSLLGPSGALYLGPGGWAPPAADDPGGQWASGVVARPDTFSRYYPSVAPEWIDATALKKVVATPNPKEDLLWLLDPGSRLKVFWLGWPGLYGFGPDACPGPKFLGPPAPWKPLTTGVLKLDAAGYVQPRFVTDRLWWSHPDQFQTEYLQLGRGPRPVRPVTVLLDEWKVDFPPSKPCLPPAPAAGTVEYAPFGVVVPGGNLADAARGTGDLLLARVTPPRPSVPGGSGPRSPSVIALMQRNSIEVALPPNEDILVLTPKKGDFEAIVQRLLEPDPHDWVALTVRIDEARLKKIVHTLELSPEEALLEEMLPKEVIEALHDVQTRMARVVSAFLLSIDYLDNAAAEVVRGFLTKEAILFFLAGIVLPMIPVVGWFFEGILIAIGIYFLGVQALDGLDLLSKGILLALFTTTKPELDLAARYLAGGITVLTVAAFFALLTRQQGAGWWKNRSWNRPVKPAPIEPTKVGAEPPFDLPPEPNIMGGKPPEFELPPEPGGMSASPGPPGGKPAPLPPHPPRGKLPGYFTRSVYRRVLQRIANDSEALVDSYRAVSERAGSRFEKVEGSPKKMKPVAEIAVKEIVENPNSEVRVYREVGPNGNTNVDVVDPKGRGTRFVRPKSGEIQFKELFETLRRGTFADSVKLQQHYADHGTDFGAKSAAEYELQANRFLNDPKPPGVLEKTRPGSGDIVRYNPTTQEFGVVKPDGTIRTYYKPDPAIHGKPTNLDYFNAQ